MSEPLLVWRLLYTKPHAEEWAQINLRRQGFATLLPRVAEGSAVAPLFPRYIFSGCHNGQSIGSMSSTSGVLYVVHCGERPARVPTEVVEGIRSRMNGCGLVRVSEAPSVDPVFAKTQRERLRALEKLVAAGFRVKVA